MGLGLLGDTINNLIGIGLAAALILIAVKPDMFTKKPDAVLKIAKRKYLFLALGGIIFLVNAVMIAARISSK